MQMVIDRFGRMVLPKAIREDFGLHPGDVLDAEETKDSIVLRPPRRADVLRDKGRVLVFNGKPDGDMAGAIAKSRAERIERVSGMRSRK